MKTKILLFTDTWFLHFGMARILQKNQDFELYAIIDVDDKARRFFENQKLVHYEKLWYYMDCLPRNMKSPDVNYLKSFEQKYGINLWSVAYTDRDFYKYNVYHKFSESEILQIIENECRFFESILDDIKPDFLSIFLTATHYHHLLVEMCKARGIKILMLGVPRFGNRAMISEDGLQFDTVKKIKVDDKNKRMINMKEYLERYDSSKEVVELKKSQFESKPIERYLSILRFFILKSNPNYKYRYSNYGRTKLKVLVVKISNFFKKKYRWYFINKHFLRGIDEKMNFIYYPLHYDPERMLQISAPFHTDQIPIILNIVKSLPIGYYLYVKEHPAMKMIGWRKTDYYKQIMNIPNVRLIHPSVSNEKMIENCSLVITIGGTTGREALFYKKPVISFTDQMYTGLPGVYRIKNIEELPAIISKSLETKVDFSYLDEFLHMVDENTFELDLVKLTSDFSYRFGFKGPTIDAELSSVKIETFLVEYNTEFEKLAEEHVKKIKQWKDPKT